MVPDAELANGFDTPRLRLGPLDGRARPKGLSALLTPPVLKHLPPSLGVPPGGAAAWLTARLSEAAVLAMTRRDDASLAGLLLIAPDADDPNCRHVGYILEEAAWGQGLASEALAGLVGAFSAGPPRLISGGVDADNPASARVLEKAGFRLETRGVTSGVSVYVRQVGAAPISGTCPG